MRGPGDKTRLSYWFPLIEKAGLPVPKTVIVRLSEEDQHAVFERLDGRDASLDGTVVPLRLAAALVGGEPVFLRTDHTSMKHSWAETCHVASLENLEAHVLRLCEEALCADFMGFPIDTLVVREMLKTDVRFRAFRGRMPITREFRFFVRDGVIEHRQPYWPPTAIEDHEPDLEAWRGSLAGMNELREYERGLLDRLTQKASEVVPGYWLVDWLQDIERGWVLTDMAEGDKSFRWDGGL